MGTTWRPKRLPFRFIPIPAIVFEEWLQSGKTWSQNEILVLGFIVRQLYGLSKPREHIALREFAEFSGLSVRTVSRMLASLQKRGVIRVTGSVKRPRKYEILMARSIEFGKDNILSIPDDSVRTLTLSIR